MTWNECREWAAETMQKTFDGKRWKFAHAAQNIAEKAYVEGVDAGFEAARRIVFADYKKLSEVFPGADWENIGPYHEYAFENIDGREAVKAWEEYDAEQEDPINAEDGLYVVYVRFAGSDYPFPVTMGTREYCKAYATSFNDWHKEDEYIVAKVEEGF